MKTPSFLLLALAAALPSLAAADPQPAPAAGRCDAAWLARSQDLAARGFAVPDDQKYLKTETVEGAGTRQVLAIETAPKVCDATVWAYLVKKGVGDAGAPFWRDDALKAAWAGGLNEQLKILLTVDDLYKQVDPKGRDALAKADAVAAAAAKLGLAAGTAGAPAKATASGTEAAAALSALLKDSIPAKVKKGAKPAASKPLPGPAVLAFRASVIELAGTLASHAAKRDLAAAHGVRAPINDFTGVPGASYAPVAAAGVAAAAADDAAYQAALKYLTDPAIKDAADEGAYDSVALSRLDHALRNQLALRAAAVDEAVAAAKKMLSGGTVKSVTAGMTHDAKAAAPAKGVAPAKDSLAAEVLEKLKGTSEYGELSKIYDNNKDNKKGVDARAQMDRMEADAAATTIGTVGKKPALQFSIGGQKVTDTGILVADLKTDKDYRAFIANSVAQNIAGDGKLQAALAALRGKGDSGTVITPPLTPDQKAPAAELPVPAKTPPPAPSPWEALVKATPSAGFFGWFSSAETAERYASHQNEEASRIAADAARARDNKEAALNRSAAAADRGAALESQRKLAAAAAQAKADEEKIRQAPVDPDLSAEEAARIQKEQIAAREKAAAEQKAKIEADAKAAKAARDAADAKALKDAQEAAAKAKAESDAKLKALDETVDKAYSDGVAKAEAALHADYKKPGSDRRDAAEKESGYTGSFYRVERVDKYFGDVWEGDKLPAATAACKTKLGFKMPVGAGDGFKDPSADNVDGLCGVRNGLVTLLKSYRGSVKTTPAPAGAK